MSNRTEAALSGVCAEPPLERPEARDRLVLRFVPACASYNDVIAVMAPIAAPMIAPPSAALR